VSLGVVETGAAAGACDGNRTAAQSVIAAKTGPERTRAS
jgi:hypothetical protein